MAIKVELTDFEAIVTASALMQKIEHIRKVLPEMDAKFGRDMNYIHRNNLESVIVSYNTLSNALIAQGYMTYQPCEPQEIDSYD